MTRSDTYVLVQTDGHTGPIAGSLLDLPGVISADDVRGPTTPWSSRVPTAP